MPQNFIQKLSPFGAHRLHCTAIDTDGPVRPVAQAARSRVAHVLVCVCVCPGTLCFITS